jgi:hypothetical protein
MRSEAFKGWPLEALPYVLYVGVFPLYVGFFIAFWAPPTMTLGHLIAPRSTGTTTQPPYDEQLGPQS